MDEYYCFFYQYALQVFIIERKADCNAAGISQDEARRLGLPERGIQALPREMSFPTSKSDNWHEKYDLIR